ncbi:unnamed protein product, partial [Rotaria sp. Silwood1]
MKSTYEDYINPNLPNNEPLSK